MHTFRDFGCRELVKNRGTDSRKGWGNVMAVAVVRGEIHGNMNTPMVVVL